MSKLRSKNVVIEYRGSSFELINLERLKHLHFWLFLIILSVAFSSSSFAQMQEMPKDAEPPPLKVISKEERELLSKTTKIKDRTKLSLELMDLHLQKAEEFNSTKQYNEMFKEFGKFHALIDNALWFLNRNDTDSGKVLDNFKRLEMGLRTFLPRLELIRRELPLNFEFYVRGLIVNVRDARSKAVDPQFGNTVLPGNPKGN
jgi:hypothetical protein